MASDNVFVGRENDGDVCGERENDGGVYGVMGCGDVYGERGSGDVCVVKGSGDVCGVKGSGDVCGVKGSGGVCVVKGSGDVCGVKGSGDVCGVKGSGDVCGVKGSGGVYEKCAISLLNHQISWGEMLSAICSPHITPLHSLATGSTGRWSGCDFYRSPTHCSKVIPVDSRMGHSPWKHSPTLS